MAKIAGFEWDDGNREKCLKHGVSIEEIEELFDRVIAVQPDPSTAETRYRAIGRTGEGRAVFLAFTLRERDGKAFIRPISARFMHRREIERYEADQGEVEEASGAEDG
jgi:uncharacterized DUF497 family protein